jgi:dimethylargininase
VAFEKTSGMAHGTRVPRALTRPVPNSFANCELTYQPRVPIDLARARKQHAAYEHALTQMGCVVESVGPAMDMPDSVFVEDTAVVFDEIAVIARPGAASRRRETDAVAAALGRHRRLAAICAPATLDGGDVLRVDREVFVGISGRTNGAGVTQLTELISPYRYRVHTVQTRGCLHLKSAATCAGDDLIVYNPEWVDPRHFVGLKRIEIDPKEPFAANVVRIGDSLLVSAEAPNTRTRLENRGLNVRVVDMSELAKAEGALTCCSLIVA